MSDEITDEMRDAVKHALATAETAESPTYDVLADAVIAAVAPLIEARVRERCAKVADEHKALNEALMEKHAGNYSWCEVFKERIECYEEVADAIRARGETK